MGSAADLASVVGSCGKFRCSLLLVDQGLLSHLNSPLLLERSAHQLKEHLGLFVSLSGCNKSDVHTAYLIDLVVLDPVSYTHLDVYKRQSYLERQVMRPLVRS